MVWGAPLEGADSSCMMDEDELVFAYLVGGTGGGEVH